MSKDIQELQDNLLENINGGVLNEYSFLLIDDWVKAFKKNGGTLEKAKELINDLFNSGDPNLLSDDNSPEDLKAILDYIEKVF